MATVHQRNNATENKVCPVSNCCSSLILKQINADEAVYVCSNPECFYPVGEEVEIVSRKVPELSLKEELQDELSSSRQIPEKEDTSKTSLQDQQNYCYDSLLDPDICDLLDSMT